MSDHMDVADDAAFEPKVWDLGPETEYRFELDPGMCLVIVVSTVFSCVHGWKIIRGFLGRYCAGTLRSLALSW